MSHRLKAYVLLLLTSIIWGVASPVIKYTLGFIKPFNFLFWRFLTDSILFLPIFILYKRKKAIKLSRKKIIKYSFLGFLGTTACLGLLFLGYNYTTAIDGVLIYSVSPIFVVIGGALLLKEEVTGLEKLGSLVAFSGSIVTVIQSVLEGKAFALNNIFGNLLVLASAFTWAVYCLLVRRFESKDHSDPLVLTAVGFFAGFITVIPFFILENYATFSQTQTWLPNRQALPGILFMSIFSSLIAYYIYNIGYSLIEASEATIFDYLKPIFAAPLAIVWLGEKITLPFLAGATLIFTGIILTEYKPKAIEEIPQ